jgi:hypothetical protein
VVREKDQMISVLLRSSKRCLRVVELGYLARLEAKELYSV